eukprot:gnl/TRDRNA2_/TRDRNA2_93539_c0_seq2.p1 gnl/TRDRNA2_/TRDRNA2_93539_c0~~gnl/TRDRNA2_/TRDRNA2_93539_c0_seq2.p1  ORF type:complete len:423 (+),score=59.21 gnl/TRDRNA2_/TRDRNA2_93539_c0_seq2:64-1269(+)
MAASRGYHLAYCVGEVAALLHGGCGRPRTLFQELRRPLPIPLTINRRRDWPLLDLERTPRAQADPAAMDSVMLARYASECLERHMRSPARRSQPSKDHVSIASSSRNDPAATPALTAIALRFAELCPQMEPELAVRLLRCLARARCSDEPSLQVIAQGLALEEYRPSALAQIATAFVAVREFLGPEEQPLFRRIAARVPEHDETAWGVSAPTMIAALVESATDVSLSVYDVLVRATVAASPIMSPLELEVSAYACARMARCYPGGDVPGLAHAREALLRHGSARIGRFQPRGLLNFFVAMERLAGPEATRSLANLVRLKLLARGEGYCVSCSPGDRYRAALCLLRCQAGDPAVLAILIGDPTVLSALGGHARAAIRGRLQSASKKTPTADWLALLQVVEAG